MQAAGVRRLFIATWYAGIADTAVIVIVTHVMAKEGVNEGNSFAFRVTGKAMAYNLRLPVLDEQTRAVTVSINDLYSRKVWEKRVDLATGLAEMRVLNSWQRAPRSRMGLFLFDPF